MIPTPASDNADIMLTLFGPHRAEAATAAAAYRPAASLDQLLGNRVTAEYDPFERYAERVSR